ncbi:MAG TPA: serine/threonine-protein kinase [Kofleriaceae bacterium]|nr:serine/threonine-protein kinase [Kofleriaceae bacterium]
MDRIGDYFVRRLVGEGGMGKVYEAEERLSRRRVALKVLRPELGRSEEARRRFLDEMNILAHLDHPNIVRSLASTEVDGELVMALEFLDGETLRARLSARGRLPWTEAVAIASEVAAALTAAHGQEPPIVHRDLKPENLMLTPTGVKVMDFGIGKVLQAMRKGTTGSVGTLAYMSPEQIDAAPVDHRADLYALGLVLYEMLAGRPPFASESPRQLLEMQCTAPPPPLPDEARAGLPRGVERLLARLLAKAPAERPASAHEVIAALEPFATASTAVTAAGSNPGLPTQSTSPTQSTLPAQASPPVAPRMDTIALVDRASGPRQISNQRAAGIVVALCLVVGAATYVVRSQMSGGGARAATPTTEPTSAASR